MRLTEEQIRFIDSYLKNAGVEYLDIRCEMTDHVAAALEEQEGEFMDNFKAYMLRHKKGLLASNRKFRRIAGRKAVLLLLRNLAGLRFLIMLATIISVTYLMVQAYDLETVTDNFFTGFMLFFVVMVIYYWYIRLSGRSKFSVANSVIGISSFVIYLAIIAFRAERWMENEFIPAYYGFFLVFMIEVVLTFRQLKKKYELQYGS
ncbi:hypothetical protein HYN59_04730 [Flavobacterium album]|uniref:Uncharacterized protein n=1 Tax=Flavobacterium album TaxID=2175091 RepID=A0A2S1QVP5_9FLAO|nr:hypothetical protein [Flavobacterium album]AWH84464.1 hypothetical protein HYN59_04730 [Flavobacterium album]